MRTVSGLSRLVLALLLAAAAALAVPGSAAAHTALTGSSPEDGEELAESPAEVVLTFNEPVQNFQPIVTVVGPAGDSWEGSPVDVVGDTVSVPVNPLGPAGTYTVAYRVVAADGHPVEGTLSFTLTAAGTGGPNAAPPQIDPADADVPPWAWAGIAVLVVLGIALAGVATARRRRA